MLHPIWDPATPKVDQWIKIPRKNWEWEHAQLKHSFAAHYRIPNNRKIDQVKQWLDDIRETCVDMPDMIEICNEN